MKKVVCLVMVAIMVVAMVTIAVAETKSGQSKCCEKNPGQVSTFVRTSIVKSTKDMGNGITRVVAEDRNNITTKAVTVMYVHAGGKAYTFESFEYKKTGEKWGYYSTTPMKYGYDYTVTKAGTFNDSGVSATPVAKTKNK